jgi:hypothetical protein
MKKLLTTFICATLASFTLLPLNAAAGTKKNDPNKKEVEKILKEAGDTHYVEKMKISSLCSLKFEDASGEDDFYHIYNASMKAGGYRIVIFNNEPKYLGYYETEYEGADYEEGAVLLDSGDSDEDGNTTYYNLPIPNKGPADKVRIDGVPTAFVKAPGADSKKESGLGKAAGGGATAAVVDENAPQYRDWKITIQGKERVYNAIFVSAEKGKVTIKDSKRGKNATVPVSALSSEDVEYLKKIMAK